MLEKNKKVLIVLILTFELVLTTFVVYYFFLQKSPLEKLSVPEKKLPIEHFRVEKPQFFPEPLTLERVFSDNHEWTATLSAQKVRTLVATGDVVLARSVNFKTTQLNNFVWPFEKTGEFLRRAEISLINLESPLLKNCPLTNTGMIFCGAPGHIEGLVWTGVDVVNLANNHLENYGSAGVESTLNLLEEVDILAVGINQPVFKEVRGLKFAFLGYDDVAEGDKIATANEERIREEVGEAKEAADLVIVNFHWGGEYTSQPSQRQEDLAHLAIETGGDLIVGNHPHWIQPVEIYRNKLIVYAHGNFIFDQMWSEKTEEGVVGRYVFYDDQLIDVEFLPIEIADYGQPYFLMGAEKERVLKELKEFSQVLAGKRRSD